MSLLQGADPFGGGQGGGSGGGKGNQGDPKGPKGNPRAPSAPLGGWAHGALWGYSEAIPNGKAISSGGLLRKEAHSKAKESRPRENDLK